VVAVQNKKEASLNTLWQLLAMSYAVVMKVSPKTPTKLAQIATQFKWRVIIGLWFLMSIILTNGYRGIVVSALTTPQHMIGSFSEFDQLQGFIVITSLRGYLELHNRVLDTATVIRKMAAKNSSCMAFTRYGIHPMESCMHANYVQTLERDAHNYESTAANLTV